jgi:hypothetical protein
MLENLQYISKDLGILGTLIYIRLFNLNKIEEQINKKLKNKN